MDVGKELAALKRMGVAALREKYAEVFGEATRSGNRAWLLKRVAWRVQALAHGDLTDRARQRAAELARDADLRIIAPRTPSTPASKPAPAPTATGRLDTVAHDLDPRLPPPGSVLARPYKGAEVRVTVLLDGFEYEGAHYGSLSAVAKAVTGSHTNGFLFFGLTRGERK
jgi:Protein of unknown function (DUF2924)